MYDVVVRFEFRQWPSLVLVNIHCFLRLVLILDPNESQFKSPSTLSLSVTKGSGSPRIQVPTEMYS